jgi:hypothetical protein
MAERGVYEVWDLTTGNRLGETLTLEVAKAAERAEMALAAFDRGSGMGGQPNVEPGTDQDQPNPPRRQPPPTE